MFGIGPKGFDAVDRGLMLSKFIVAMVDTKMPGIADICQAVMGAPPVRMYNTIKVHSATNDPYTDSVCVHQGQFR